MNTKDTSSKFTESEAVNYVFHGWRYFFTSYMVGKLNKKLLKSQTGHKTDDIIGHYNDHETIGGREIIQTMERKMFAGLIPERAKMLVFKKEPLAIAACG